MKKALIIGATSGIGRALAAVLAEQGYALCLTGRRTPLLQSLQEELPGEAMTRQMDVADTTAALSTFQEIVTTVGGLDLVVISAGTGFLDPDFTWEKEKETIDVNVSGFAAMANAAYHLFCAQGNGHLVGISSIAAVRGGGAPAYNASKAFVSNYLEGLRYKIAKTGLPVYITDILPGFVDTEMAKGEGLFWVQPPRKAAEQIYAAIQTKKKRAYITKRWRLIAWILKLLPDALYHKM